MRPLFTFGFLIASAFAAQAQYPGQYPGQYPPGQYPPGQYPGGGGMGIPMPNIHLPKRKPKDSNTSKVTVVSLDGTLRHLGEKDLLAETSSSKILRFRLIARTEFRGKDGKSIRDSLLHPGDRLTIDTSPDDPETALHVILVRAGSSSEREAAGYPVDEARVSTPDSSDFGRPHSSTESADNGAPVSDSSGGGDNERPTLHRQTDSDSNDSPQAAPSRPSITRDSNSNDSPASEAGTHDPKTGDPSSVIDDARDAARSFTSELPNFLVQQVTTRTGHYPLPGIPVRR
jgi:hypothetical protein